MNGIEIFDLTSTKKKKEEDKEDFRVWISFISSLLEKSNMN